jgi:uncharacterized protein YbjT (DUF2867 family)
MTGFDHMLVTGATGNIGAPLIERLNAQGTHCRAAVLNPNNYQTSHPNDVVRLDFTDVTTFAEALRGIDSIFLIRPPNISKVGQTINRFISEAQLAGVKHVVFSSVAGAKTNRLLPHHKIEKHLLKTDVAHTIVRPTFFANNLGDAYRNDIRNDHRLFVPAGGARVAFIDAQDIAAVVASIARDPEPHEGQGYTLTGSTNYSFDEVANLLTDQLHKTILYEPATIHNYIAHLYQQKLAFSLIGFQTLLHLNLRRGKAALVDPTLQTLLGRPSTTMGQYIQENLHLWYPTPATQWGGVGVTLE